jgi:Lon protease-like protein
VVALTEGQEVRQAGSAQEQFCDVGTLASIEKLDNQQPGLITLLCRGTQRFRIMRRSQLMHGLWMADIEHIDEDVAVAVPDDLKATATALSRVLHTLRQREPEISTLPSARDDQFNDCAWVANRWCELLPVPIELKQRLMELENPLVRLELVGDVLERTGIAQ